MDVVYKKPISDMIYNEITKALLQNKTIQYIVLTDIEAKELYNICKFMLPYRDVSKVCVREIDEIHNSQYYGVQLKVKSLMEEK